MSDVQSLKDTIVPKSDQLNADDLLTGPIVITIQKVSRGDTKEQPVSIAIDGGRMPYKPCKSMRRVLIAAWGEDGRLWVGKSMRLFCDPEVMFGGVKVGGIRISHLSHIANTMTIALTTTRSKRAPYRVEPLEEQAEKKPFDYDAAVDQMRAAVSEAQLAAIYTPALARAKKDQDKGTYETLQTVKNECLAALRAGAEPEKVI
jgi:hypothetical protein